MKYKNLKDGHRSRAEHPLSRDIAPRRYPVFLCVLMLVGVLSLAGVVTADDYWQGAAPETNLSGMVSGGVDVLFSNTWKTTNPVDYDDAWANFTLTVTPSASTPLEFARLYVVMYTANMTDNWYGNFSVTLKDGTYSAYAYPVEHKALDLSYNRNEGATYGSVSGGLKTLSRVTSDYVAVIDVKNTLQGWGNDDIRVHVETWNESLRLQDGLTRFDGRIKEVKLVYGWNTTSNPQTIKYWINEGHDPVTKDEGTYTGQTEFNGVGNPASYDATLWVDYLSSAGGLYTWNEIDISPDSDNPPSTIQGNYAGLHEWSWDENGDIGLSETGNDVLTYDRSNNWYKIIAAILAVKT